ncbi:nuclear transport factor 2 family protein [Roseibium sp. MB-4]
MDRDHPNLSLLKDLDIQNVRDLKHVFREDVVWHFFHAAMPDLHGDYTGIEQIADFFESLKQRSAGTFTVLPRDARAIGNELVVVETQNSLVLDGSRLTFEVAIVWRIIDGQIAEVWDIPAINTASHDSLNAMPYDSGRTGGATRP